MLKSVEATFLPAIDYSDTHFQGAFIKRAIYFKGSLHT